MDCTYLIRILQLTVHQTGWIVYCNTQLPQNSKKEKEHSDSSRIQNRDINAKTHEELNFLGTEFWCIQS